MQREVTLLSRLELGAAQQGPSPFPDDFHQKPGLWQLLTPPSTIPPNPSDDPESNLQADAPDRGSSKSWRVPAGMERGTASPHGPAAEHLQPQNCPQHPLSCNLSLDLLFQLRCRGERSDIKFQGLEIPLPRTCSPQPSISSEAEILTLRGKFSKLTNCLLHT